MEKLANRKTVPATYNLDLNLVSGCQQTCYLHWNGNLSHTPSSPWPHCLQNGLYFIVLLPLLEIVQCALGLCAWLYLQQHQGKCGPG
jgi:hypothetical protein